MNCKSLEYNEKRITIAGFQHLDSYEIMPTAGLRPVMAKPVIDKTINIGWDTEYVQGDQTTDASNDIVSHQFWFLELGLGLLILRPTHATKLTLDEVIRLVHRFALDHKKGITTLRFITHYSVAEFSSTIWKNTVTKRLKNLISVQKSITSKKPDIYNYPDHHRNTKNIVISFHDTNLLSGNQTLKNLGEVIGLPKVVLQSGAIQNMRFLLNSDRDLYVRYAMQDAVITVAWFSWLLEEATALRLIAPGEIPITASHMAGLYLGHALHDGSKEGGMKILTGRSAGYQAPDWGYTEAAKITYHGGRNEAYIHGYADGLCKELDLKSAYPIALACLYDPDWDDVRSFQSVDELPGPFILGAAHVRFKFSDDCPAPFFAVESERGLIFPLSGETGVTATEVWAAHQSGYLEHLEIVNGIVFGCTSDRRISGAISHLIRERDRVKLSDPSTAGILKLIANSVYGKLAQNIRPRKVVDLFNSLTQDTRVTYERRNSFCQSPFVAAYITAVTRCLIAEIVNKARAEGLRVVNVTTDAIQIEGDFQAAWLSELPLYRMVELTKDELFGTNMNLIEVKHETQGMISIKTRMSWGTDPERLSAKAEIKKTRELPLQRGGLQTRDAEGGKLEHRDACLDLHRRYIENNWSFTRYSLSGLTAMLPRAHSRNVENDLRNVLKTVTISADYDLKRRIVLDSLRMVRVPDMKGGQVERIYFDTAPWRDQFEAAAAHDAYKAWKERVRRRRVGAVCHDVLNGIDEIIAFDAFRRLYEVADGQVSDLETICLEKVAWAMLKEGATISEVCHTTNFKKKKLQNISKRSRIELLDQKRHPEACYCMENILSKVLKPSIKRQVERRVFNHTAP